MTHISIIGNGAMAQAIATAVARSGHTAETLAHGSDQAPTGQIVVLAVPYGALRDVVATHGDHLAGRVVVDISNPVDFETFDSLVVAPEASAAAELAAALPHSRVVKAFNTTFAGTLSSGTVGDSGLPTAVLIAGDDTDAKQQLADVVTGAGLRAIDAGSLRRARELEALGFLQITLAAGEKVSWTGGFAVVA